MPPSCSICSRPDRAEIDKALVAGVPVRELLPGHSGTSKSALDRHRKHIPAALAQARQASEVAEATTLLSRIERLTSRCERFLDRAEESGESSEVASAFRELRGYLELLGKVSGELQSGGMRVSISISDIQKIDIGALTDEQLQALNSRVRSQAEGMSDEEIEFALGSFALRSGFVRTRVKDAHLFDEESVPAPSGGNHICWSNPNRDAFEDAKNMGFVAADMECPLPKWTPYRDSSPSDRFRMLQATWKRVTGLELPSRISAEELGEKAAIAIEFDLADPREEYWHTWPAVRLLTVARPATPAGNDPLSLPQTIEGE